MLEEQLQQLQGYLNTPEASSTGCTSQKARAKSYGFSWRAARCGAGSHEKAEVRRGSAPLCFQTDWLPVLEVAGGSGDG